MNQSELEALLGRTLSPTEVSNLTLYLDIATDSLEDLLCMKLDEITEERVYDVRKGYSTAFVDIFSEVTEVKLDDDVVETADYSVRQWDRRSGSWYNSVVFDDKFTSNGEVTITATWGFPASSGSDSDLPLDLQSVLAGLFALVTKKNKFDGTVSSKQVEDFRISFNTSANLDEEFNQKYSNTIRKYSMCSIGNTQHGKICDYGL